MSEFQSAASQVFAIDELMLLVLDYLSPPNATRSNLDSRSLASLARVSRSISDAALNALWRSVHQPKSIVELLPDDAYEIYESQEGKLGEYRLKRPLVSSDFVAFDKYAPRVRFVDFSTSSKLLGRGCELLPHIKVFRDPILPSLSEFCWEPSVENGSIEAFHLISRQASLPSDTFSLLMWAEIEHPVAEPDILAETIDSFNDPLLRWLPAVKKLTLRTVHYLPGATAINLENLEYLSCDFPINAALLMRLADLPRLRFLDMRFLLDSPTVIPANSASFPMLEDLHINAPQSYIRAILALISSSTLRSLYLVQKDSHHPIEPSFFPSPAPAYTSSLRHFTYTIPYNPVIASPRLARLALAAFAPLYACCSLQTFRIKINALEVVFTDADVRAMAHAWPALTTLSVAPARPRTPHTPAVHLYALSALAAGCPGLRSVAMAVDADVSEVFCSEQCIAGEALERLALFCSPCGEPVLVADFLNRVFPRLCPRDFRALALEDRPQDEERWRTVGSLLSAV
ncbi:hypothetical protein C8J57DRAFT_1310085 [Mycena rebaudengoi]|nr:hypothetical protein C8J57DRAFT_1310085 [Mycena rebaudengoi]